MRCSNNCVRASTISPLTNTLQYRPQTAQLLMTSISQMTNISAQQSYYEEIKTMIGPNPPRMGRLKVRTWDWTRFLEIIDNAYGFATL